MKNTGTWGFEEPRFSYGIEVKKKYGQSSRRFLFIYILFTIIVVLSLYCISLYNANMKVNSQYRGSYDEIKIIMEENKNLKDENFNLMIENTKIKQTLEKINEEFRLSN